MPQQQDQPDAQHRDVAGQGEALLDPAAGRRAGLLVLDPALLLQLVIPRRAWLRDQLARPGGGIPARNQGRDRVMAQPAQVTLYLVNHF